LKTAVLDANALIGFMEASPGAEPVKKLISLAREGQLQLLMSVINWGEVYYQIMRRLGEAKAQEIERLIRSFPIHLVEVDLDLTREAARFKAAKRMSYADCFAAALAKHKKAELVTGDKEFKQVEHEIKVAWI